MKNRAYLLVLYAKKFVNHNYQPNTSDSMELSGGIDFVKKMYFDCLEKDISDEIQEPKPENKIEREQLLPGDIVFTDISHISIYIGNNEIIHADENNIVKISKITNFYKAIRIDKSLKKLNVFIIILIIILMLILEILFFVQIQVFIKLMRIGNFY